MEIDLVLDDIERLVRNIRTFTSVLKDMQNICDVEVLKSEAPKKKTKSKSKPKVEPEPEPLAELIPVGEVEAPVCEPIKKSKKPKMRKPKLERC